ncbi:MAG: hypothetical protein M3Q49_18450, partial [Actinomycetota bacterium]|nr:hypothetical protein [Actinomycetota bacterium]
TDPSGNFSFSGLKPSKNTDYRVRFAGNAAAGLRGSVSPTSRVNVRVLVTAQLSSANAKAASPSASRGRLAPPTPARSR